MGLNAQNFSKYLEIVFVYRTAAPGNFIWIYDGSSCKKRSQAIHNKGTVFSSGSADYAQGPPSFSDKQRGKPDGEWAYCTYA
jgi:hypothetical protein